MAIVASCRLASPAQEGVVASVIVRLLQRKWTSVVANFASAVEVA